jgi:hypothetical protein
MDDHIGLRASNRASMYIRAVASRLEQQTGAVWLFFSTNNGNSMTTKRYYGSCHCGSIRFEADIDLSKGTMRCNCSFCSKIRCWAVPAAQEAFHLISGEAELSEYKFGAKNERHFFCKQCGVRPFGIGNSPKRGLFYGINVACLDSATIEELTNSPVTYIDGINDNWETPPAATRHL